MYADLNCTCGSKKENEHVYGKETIQPIYNLNENNVLLELKVEVKVTGAFQKMLSKQ